MNRHESFVFEALHDQPPDLAKRFFAEVDYFLTFLRSQPDLVEAFGVPREFEMEAAVRRDCGSPTAPAWTALAESVKLASQVLELDTER